ncbi:MAG: 30S ribosome-binding factor RbfA [Candidatus Omnitrophica bacterium]|nr:30S ribosome-binding factor RbfA [Candidatus Omnitrophota bacterium]
MSRMDKLNQQVKREISSMLLMGDVRDPRVAFVTITFADISKDLSYAHIGFSVLTDDPQAVKSAQEGLNSASGRVRKLIGERLSVRHIPEIRFVYDDSIVKAVKMDRTLEEIRQERERASIEKGDEGGTKNT